MHIEDHHIWNRIHDRIGLHPTGLTVDETALALDLKRKTVKKAIERARRAGLVELGPDSDAGEVRYCLPDSAPSECWWCGAEMPAQSPATHA